MWENYKEQETGNLEGKGKRDRETELDDKLKESIAEEIRKVEDRLVKAEAQASTDKMWKLGQKLSKEHG